MPGSLHFKELRPDRFAEWASETIVTEAWEVERFMVSVVVNWGDCVIEINGLLSNGGEI